MKYSVRTLMIVGAVALLVIVGLAVLTANQVSRDINRYYFPKAAP